MASKNKGKVRIGHDKPKKYKRRQDAFSIHIVLVPTEETFNLDDTYNDMTVSELKDDLEFATGIPVNIQRLSYLDDGMYNVYKIKLASDLRSDEVKALSSIIFTNKTG